MGGRRLARSLSRGAAAERLMNAIFMFLNSSNFRLRSIAFQISTWLCDQKASVKPDRKGVLRATFESSSRYRL